MDVIDGRLESWSVLDGGESCLLLCCPAEFFKLSMGGCLTGAAVFLLLHRWLHYNQHKWHETMLAILLTIYGYFYTRMLDMYSPLDITETSSLYPSTHAMRDRTYFIAEVLFGVSGILAEVTFGLLIAWYPFITSISTHVHVWSVDRADGWICVIGMGSM